MTIEKVWIEEGCISCSLCMDIAPDVFDVPDGEDCRIHARARDFFAGKRDDIELAAADCPVEVIHVEKKAVPVSADRESDAPDPAGAPRRASAPGEIPTSD